MESYVSNKRGPSALWAHVLPFAAWIGLMHFLDVPALPPAWAYAIRSGLCLGLLLYLRPWRWYSRPVWRHFPMAALWGVGVFVAWVGLEHPAVGRWGALQEFYVRWGIRPFGELRPEVAAFPFAPETCGWFLTAVRILGSGLVIGVIEEFFWRGFLYRWIFGGEFTAVDPGRFGALPFFAVALAFGFEHMEWAAGIVAGLAYGWLFLKTRDIWAVSFAHALTNILLGAYVVATGSYQFW
ncbi:MAG: CAAX prenyl protease-related protein [Verrucomicrobia bacterium]|nr:CAAX prenyl protease-related protein [Kiritimatiellia bacterium]MCO6400759.1 CAAX prenyl protease-related protein [Verrucomicrobiota bacterium]